MVSSPDAPSARSQAVPPRYWTAGVDGCRGGWLVVLAAYDESAAQPLQGAMHVCARFAEVLALRPRPIAVAVDMPIGLLDCAVPGGRECDRAARGLLGRPRASSVFSPPARPALVNSGYADAMLHNGAGLSKQAYNILPQIREVDDAMTPALQRRVFETHPELVFARLAGHPMRHPKRTAGGAGERLACLQRVWGKALPDPSRTRAELGRSKVALHDVLDACVLAHAAWRIHCGDARRHPPIPARDTRGLRMEVWG
jgi:predicted RNase H-like nuclease